MVGASLLSFSEPVLVTANSSVSDTRCRRRQATMQKPLTAQRLTHFKLVTPKLYFAVKSQRDTDIGIMVDGTSDSQHWHDPSYIQFLFKCGFGVAGGKRRGGGRKIRVFRLGDTLYVKAVRPSRNNSTQAVQRYASRHGDFTKLRREAVLISIALCPVGVIENGVPYLVGS